jgi:hypothetical protein
MIYQKSIDNVTGEGFLKANDSEKVDVDEDETEDTDPFSKHRCSMVKRYNMPTFFATVPEKRLQTPSKPV